MKKKLFTTLLSLLIIASALLAACSADKLSATTPAGGNAPADTYESQIRTLEEQILVLAQNQYENDVAHQKELAALTEQLKALRAESESADKQDPEKEESQDSSSVIGAARFLYTVSEGKATITGYTGDVARLVIPSAIDGYAVDGIADGAFKSSLLKSVTISSGIRFIDWFAFCDCENLESVTIPSTVTSIGYAAFPQDSKKLTLYCHTGSFAQSYAQSYGLNYAVI